MLIMMSKAKHLNAHRIHANDFRNRQTRLKKQGGIAILEALIAILIFSIGVLGIVGLQARAVQGLGEAGFRSQAVQHADDLIAEMWTSDPGLRKTLYESAGAGGVMYQAWATKVKSGSSKLPGADIAANRPEVVITSTRTDISILAGTSFFVSNVTITITWLAPGAAPGATSRYVTTARILEPQL
jgi:type IV pilus assembly protein PilV